MGKFKIELPESEIEAYLRTKVKALGGTAYKWTSPGQAGVPDRIVILPKGKVCFVEMKAPGESLRPLQQEQFKKLNGLGCKVFVLDSKKEVDSFIAYLRDFVL
jgi:hypothetical protein